MNQIKYTTPDLLKTAVSHRKDTIDFFPDTFIDTRNDTPKNHSSVYSTYVAVSDFSLSNSKPLADDEFDDEGIIELEQPCVRDDYPVSIPGVGDDCGKDEFVGFKRCTDCNTVDYYYTHCSSIRCPSHFRAGAMNKAVENALQRIHGYSDLKGYGWKFREDVKTGEVCLDENGELEKIWCGYLPNHVVFSPVVWRSPDILPAKCHADIKKWWNYKGTTKDNPGYFLRGLDGVYALHMFRIRGWDKRAYQSGEVPAVLYKSEENIKRRLRQYKVDNPDDHRGLWDLVRANVLGLKSWRAYCYVSPHIHFVGYGYIRPKADEFQRRYGIVYVNLHHRSYEWTPCEHSHGWTNEVKSTLSYIASHATVLDGMKSPHLFYGVGKCNTRFMEKSGGYYREETRFDVCYNCHKETVEQAVLLTAKSSKLLELFPGKYTIEERVNDTGKAVKCLVKRATKSPKWYKFQFVTPLARNLKVTNEEINEKMADLNPTWHSKLMRIVSKVPLVPLMKDYPDDYTGVLQLPKIKRKKPLDYDRDMNWYYRGLSGTFFHPKYLDDKWAGVKL